MNPAVSETQFFFSLKGMVLPPQDVLRSEQASSKTAVRTVIQSIDCSREEYITTGQFFSVSTKYCLFSNTADLFLSLGESSPSLKFSTLEAVLSTKHLITTISPHYVLFFQELQFLI